MFFVDLFVCQLNCAQPRNITVMIQHKYFTFLASSLGLLGFFETYVRVHCTCIQEIKLTIHWGVHTLVSTWYHVVRNLIFLLTHLFRMVYRWFEDNFDLLTFKHIDLFCKSSKVFGLFWTTWFSCWILRINQRTYFDTDSYFFLLSHVSDFQIELELCK